MKRRLAELYGRLVRDKRARQILLLYSSEIGLMALTVGTGILNSRFLGPTQYGSYTFVITVVEVVLLLTGFGFPNAGARVVALAKSREEEQSQYGALVVVALVMGFVMSVLLAILVPVIASLYRMQHTGALWIACIMCGAAPLQMMLSQACRGANRIGVLATSNILPKALYLLGGLGMALCHHLTANTALVLYFAGSLAGCVLMVGVLGLRFENLREQINHITKEVREYGFKTYLGGLADNSTYKLNNLLIAGYVNAAWLGFYSIASTMVAPLVRFSTSLSTSAFRSLAQEKRISSRLLLVNAGFLLAGGVFVAVCARPVIAVILTKQFLPAAGLVYVLIFTAFFQGMYQPINAFLCAQGKGRELRSISFVVSVVNLTVSLALIPRMGAYGAAVGSSVAKLAELLGNVYYYKKLTREPRSMASEPSPAAEALSS